MLGLGHPVGLDGDRGRGRRPCSDDCGRRLGPRRRPWCLPSYSRRLCRLTSFGRSRRPTAINDTPTARLSSEVLRRFLHVVLSLVLVVHAVVHEVDDCRQPYGGWDGVHVLRLPASYQCADDELADPAEEEEDDDAEQAGEDERPVHRRRRCPDSVDVHHDADAGLVAGAEELLADDGADDRQAGRDAKAGEDVRHRAGQLQLRKPGPARGVAQREQVVLIGVGRAAGRTTCW